ncbi:zinc finger BED domain-containing protein RICESLEEPER 2-like [Canna indica]|uniref:Zinc finger BED domain-containing protein RICESLEEPER 2-like n=1 Tax=Canna indica TaxID=4628 RepID=A0AAQ3QKQ4_9LILI|nr:zinc finger BED domain-containing protein RICESLEEPER 2-like [Canna indica]
MSVTAHYIDDSWVLQHRILRFVYVPAPRTMDVLAKKMIESLTQWNIETKMSTITIDNCSSNDGMIRLVQKKLSNELLLQGKLVHMRCCAHILNLIVKDNLSIIEGSIETIRDNVSFWYASPSRVEKFEDVARQLKISCTKKLALDYKT